MQGGAVSTVTWVRAGWSIDGWLSSARYFSRHYVQTSSAAHPVTYSVGAQGVEQIRLASDHSPPSSTEINNQWIYTCVSPMRPHTVKVKCSPYRLGVAQRVGRVIALLFNDRGTRRKWVVSSTLRPHFTPGKDPVPIVQEAGWAPGPVWTGGKSCPHRDSIPDRPAP